MSDYHKFLDANMFKRVRERTKKAYQALVSGSFNQMYLKGSDD